MNRRLVLLAASMAMVGLAPGGDPRAEPAPPLDPEPDDPRHTVIDPGHSHGRVLLLELPDRCAIDPASPHFRADYARIGVVFDGNAITNCAEYCVSENWVKVLISDGRGNWVKERGKPRTVRKPGKVEPYWKG